PGRAAARAHVASEALAGQNLARRAFSGLQRARYGRGFLFVGCFTGKEQRVVDGCGEILARAAAADGYVAVRAASEGIALPVVRVRGIESPGRIDLRAEQRFDRIECVPHELGMTRASERLRARPAGPCLQQRCAPRHGTPDSRKAALRRVKERAVAIAGVVEMLPECIAESQRKLDDRPGNEA